MLNSFMGNRVEQVDLNWERWGIEAQTTSNDLYLVKQG